MFTIRNTSNQPDLISAKTLRRTIGILGFLLPFILIVGAAIFQGCQLVQNSISAYYHTDMRNFFVGALCSIALCLFAYRGYSPIDNWTGNMASLFTLGVAFFPTSVGDPFTGCLPKGIDLGIISDFHFISATFLFGLLAFFCLVLFTKHSPNPTNRKLIRNRIFRFCGYIIVFCIVLIALYFLILRKQFPDLALLRPVFFLEAIALIAFSVSWLTKGEAIMGD